MKDYYKILEVAPEASSQEIKRSYYKLAFKYHPDRSDYSKADYLFTEISEAYTILSNKYTRAEYDRKRLGYGMILRRSEYSQSNPVKSSGKEAGFSKSHNISNSKRSVKWRPVLTVSDSLKRLVVVIGMGFSLILLADIIAPANVNMDSVIELIVIPGKGNKNAPNDLIITSRGDSLLISKKYSKNVRLQKEVGIYRTAILKRPYLIGISDWPHYVEIERSNYTLIMMFSILLFLVSIYGLLGNIFSRQNNLRVCLVIIGISILCLLFMIL